MRIDIKETAVYPFDELSDMAQDTVIENLSDINVNFEWWDFIFDDAATIGLKITDFSIDCNSYCQGDWTEYPEAVARLILENHGKSCETYNDSVIFLDDYARQKAIHEADDSYDPEYLEYDESSEYRDLAQEFCQTILKDYRVMLQKEYDYQISRLSIVETIKANEYEFTENGKLY